ncbi:hypothetical protein [Ferruginibacter sp.]|uniref:hypothetical protein n=1 Tax=Ferruginibacter sp. TaxID=1940288 RepID=UPI0019966528|nr:hypothetical protein [Ferruginibacter sp.]MBC7628704.1 hypothetical protein [Ferruginibacter sp.]
MRKFFLLLLLSGAFIFSKAQFINKFTTYNSANTPAFTGNNFKAVWVGKFGQIWAGTQYQGLYKFDTSTKVWSKSSQLTNVFINQIQADEKGGIWIAQSGTSGQTGGGSNTGGGVNYFPDRTDVGMQFFSTTNFLSSRNVRSVYLDTLNAPQDGYRRLWTAQATYITSGNTSAGGATRFQETSTGNMQKVFGGLQIFPTTNFISTGNPSCYGVCGNKEEVYIAAETNYTIATGSTTQILKYDATSGFFKGGYDQNGEFDKTRLYYNNQARKYINTDNAGVLPAGFRTSAMYADKDGRVWIGLRNGGVVVKTGNTLQAVNMPSIFIPGTTVNLNAITSDEYGYVYIGTTNGLVVFDNGGDVTDISSYKLLTTTDSLPSNNITGVAYDKGGGRIIITSDAGVTFWNIKYKIDVKMEWDYSFPDRVNRPIGVAADGVSRIYLRIKKGSDTLPNVQAVNVSLKRFVASEANTRGKLKPALVIDKYSEEATDATATDISMSDADLKVGVPGEFWVWYVSPEDFSNDTVSAYASLRKRYDTLTVIVTYLNNKKDTMDYKIGLVRPPTVFVHGVASSPEAWLDLKHNYFGKYVPFLSSPLFTYTNALKMDPRGYFHKNAAQLLGGDINVYTGNGDRLNTLQGNIEAMRGLRYASNQVDYVCHSMGGCMIRTAINFFPKKFFAGAGSPYRYKNYTKGFTHKVLTLDTPHNGAGVADAGDQFLKWAPDPINILLHDAYAASPDFLGCLFIPVGNEIIPKFEGSNATNNLQSTEERGGIRFGRTPALTFAPIRNHMICGNVKWDKFYSVAGFLDKGLSFFYKSLLEIMYVTTYLPWSDAYFETPASRLAARAELGTMIAEDPQVMLFNFLNYINEKRGFYNFIQNGDLIVPLSSQICDLAVDAPNVTKFINTDAATIIPPNPPHNAWHSDIPKRDDVGQRVLQLLNTKRSSELFADFFPANNNPIQVKELRPAAAKGIQSKPSNILINESFFDTTKIKIDAPFRNTVVNSDSTINIKFRVKDTARLIYSTIYFQLSDSFRVIKTLAQHSIPFTVSPSFTGSNLIMAKAVYEKSDGSGLEYRIDTLSVGTTNLATLQDFRIKDNESMLTVGQPFFPVFEAKYNDQWVTIGNGDPNILIAVDSATIVNYVDSTISFNGLKSGTAILTASFFGLQDSAILKVNASYNSGCINTTLSSGNFSNSAIWSKGVVPDICDSVIINTGHNVTVDTALIIRALRVSSGGTLTLNNTTDTLQTGEADEHSAIADIYGTLAISNGGININGRLKFNTGSTFNMIGGKITIDANEGIREMSIPDSSYLFEAAAGMTAFNFTGGTLQVNDPPFGAASQTIACPYNFGDNSTLILGVNSSNVASKNIDGFGGLSFPNKIGKLIINAGTNTGNRQFINKKALNVKGNMEVRTGSGVILQAPITVNQ